ncbi:hypothetical protein Premu_0077, partial [Hallella multisaccharivorax DSM 17128]
MNKMDAFLVANKRNYFDRLFDVKMSDEDFMKALYSLKNENLSAPIAETSDAAHTFSCIVYRLSLCETFYSCRQLQCNCVHNYYSFACVNMSKICLKVKARHKRLTSSL